MSKRLAAAAAAAAALTVLAGCSGGIPSENEEALRLAVDAEIAKFVGIYGDIDPDDPAVQEGREFLCAFTLAGEQMAPDGGWVAESLAVSAEDDLLTQAVMDVPEYGDHLDEIGDIIIDQACDGVRQND